jgi:hypothetical protein
VTLVQRIETAADAVTDRVLHEMYQNPFWQERFGERAQKHGRQDGLYHIKYLTEALTVGEPFVIEQYARWLQQLLTTRGMCTRHIDENFARLATAIAETVDDAEPAVAMLTAARKALLYPVGAARMLQDRAHVIAQQAATQLYAQHPEWPQAQRARCADDLEYHLSYAADALQLKTPTVFTSYLAFTGDFLAKRNIPREHLYESVVVLRQLVTTELPGVTLPE